MAYFYFLFVLSLFAGEALCGFFDDFGFGSPSYGPGRKNFGSYGGIEDRVMNSFDSMPRKERKKMDEMPMKYEHVSQRKGPGFQQYDMYRFREYDSTKPQAAGNSYGAQPNNKNSNNNYDNNGYQQPGNSAGYYPQGGAAVHGATNKHAVGDGYGTKTPTNRDKRDGYGTKTPTNRDNRDGYGTKTPTNRDNRDGYGTKTPTNRDNRDSYGTKAPTNKDGYNTGYTKPSTGYNNGYTKPPKYQPPPPKYQPPPKKEAGKEDKKGYYQESQTQYKKLSTNKYPIETKDGYGKADTKNGYGDDKKPKMVGYGADYKYDQGDNKKQAGYGRQSYEHTTEDKNDPGVKYTVYQPSDNYQNPYRSSSEYDDNNGYDNSYRRYGGYRPRPKQGGYSNEKRDGYDSYDAPVKVKQQKYSRDRTYQTGGRVAAYDQGRDRAAYADGNSFYYQYQEPQKAPKKKKVPTATLR